MSSDAVCLFHIPWASATIALTKTLLIYQQTSLLSFSLSLLALWISADFDYVWFMSAVSVGFSCQNQKGKSRMIASSLFNSGVCQHSVISFDCVRLSSLLSTESCTGQDLADLGDRLRDWFQLLQGNGKQNSTGSPAVSSASSEAPNFHSARASKWRNITACFYRQ